MNKHDDTNFDGQQPNGKGKGNSARTKKDRYYQAVREHESREAELNGRMDTRRQSAEEVRQRHLSLLDSKDAEYKAERADLKVDLKEAKLDLEAAHRSASEHCSEIGVRYVPGKTTEVDVLAVPLLLEAEVAKTLNLPFGVGFSDTLVKILKPVLTVLCWLMSSLSLGLGFRLLDAKNIFANPATVGLSLVMGGVVAIGLLVAITWMWKPLGAKIGSGRPTKEVAGLLIPVVLITLALLLGLAFLDAKAVILLNAARAALNPAFGIPMEVALLIGAVISGTYVIGLAGASFADGYTSAAKKSIADYIKHDETCKQTAAKRTVPIKGALEALAEVKVAEENIQNLEADIKSLDAEFKRDRAEIISALPEPPTDLQPHEEHEINQLRDRVRSAQAHHSAHAATRPDGNEGN
jgi:hypothetical protein